MRRPCPWRRTHEAGPDGRCDLCGATVLLDDEPIGWPMMLPSAARCSLCGTRLEMASEGATVCGGCLAVMPEGPPS